MKALLSTSAFLLSLAACATTATTTTTSAPVGSAADDDACANEVADLGGTPTDPNPNEVRRSKGTADRRARVACR